MKQKIKIILAYEGTNYFGWQIQNNKITVQGTLESALTTLLQEKLSVTGAGRTDAGVHAEGQVAHFLTSSERPLPLLIRGVNALLPPDIRVLSLEPADDDFHARFFAKEKIYRYQVTTNSVQLPFDRRFAHHETYKLNTDLIEEAIPYFLGTKNFKAFTTCATKMAPQRNPVKTITNIHFAKNLHGFSLTFHGDGFLYKMVRNMVGTLLDIGRGRFSPNDLHQMLASEDRRLAGKSAPARGLTLVKVNY